MIPPLEISRPDGRRLLAAFWAWGVAVLAAAAEAPPPAAGAAGQAASGAYGEKVVLVSDASVAESLARQKTVTFGAVRIDGEASGAALSALNAEQVLSAVATKVPTPDLDADAVGGLLHLTSRRAFDQKRRTLRGSMALSYDPLVGEVMPDASITFGRSLGTQNRAGFLATLEHRRGRDRDEMIELDWNGDADRLTEFGVGETGERTRGTNFNGSFDFKLGEATVLFFRTEAKFSTEEKLERVLGVELPDTAGLLADAGTVVTGATLTRALEEDRKRNSALMFAGGMSHRSDAWLMDLRSSYLETRERRVEEYVYEFEEEDVAFVFQWPEAAFPMAGGPGEPTPGDSSQDFLNELRVRGGLKRESDVVASLDLTRLWMRGAKSGWLKSGLKARFRRTTEDSPHEVYDAVGPGLRASEVGYGPAGDVLSGRYAIDRFPDFAALRRLFDTQPDRFRLDEDKTRADSDPASFDVREEVFAGYGMASLPLGASRVVAGLRAERTASRFSGNEVSFDESGRYVGTTAVAARRARTELFPGVHLSRPLTKAITGFASWTRSIRRPEYTDLVPARRIRRADRDIREGNPDLRPALYTNIDVAFDAAYRNDGRLSLELFHRDIRDPSLTRRILLNDGPFAGYERTRPENGGRARLRGLELTVEQELEALNRNLRGVEFKVHYTHLDSRQSVASRPGETLPLTNRPKHELGVQLAYDRGGYYASVELEHTSRTLDSIGRNAGEDRIVPSANEWNLSLSREFGRGLRVFLDVKNLTALAERRYRGDASRADSYGIDLREYRLGMKWER